MAGNVTITVDAGQVAANLAAYGVRVHEAIVGTTRMYGQLLVTAVQRNASGRPGPRAITGDYRRSWSMRLEQDGASVVATAGTNRPQARRLEYGFTGTDSLGRHYRQPPYPHVRPALTEIGPQFQDAVRQALSSAR